MPNKSRTRLGIEVLLDEKLDLIRGQRVGLVCNQASVLPDTFHHAADVFHEHSDINLTTLFGPQHGIRGDVQYNMIETPHVRDARTGIMVYSLYSEIARADRGNGCATSIRSSSICRMSAAASTRFSTRWPTACAPPQNLANASSSATVRIRSTATRLRATITEDAFRSFVGQFEIADTARNDDRRAGENVQRAFWHWLRSRGRRDGRLVARDVGRRDRFAVDTSVAKHSRRRHLRRLSRDRPYRGHRTQRRPRHDTAIFT